MKHPIKYIYFDVDDTLFDRRLAQTKVLELIVARFSTVFGNLGFSRIQAAFDRSDNLSLQSYDKGITGSEYRVLRNRIFLDLLGIDSEIETDLANFYVGEYPKIHAPVSGARDLVEDLHGKLKMGIISNGIPDVQYGKLRTLGILEFMDNIVLSEEVKIRKPDTAIFNTAVNSTGLKSHEVMYVGDDFEKDIIGASTAGMTTCWFNPLGNKSKKEHISIPTFTIRELLDIIAIVRNG